MNIEKGRFTRRRVVGAIGAGIVSLWLPVSLEENVEFVRRFWALDRSMVAAQEIAGDGHIIIGNDGLWVFTRDPIVGDAPVSGILVGGRDVDESKYGDEIIVRGAVWAYRTDEAHERPGLDLAFAMART